MSAGPTPACVRNRMGHANAVDDRHGTCNFCNTGCPHIPSSSDTLQHIGDLVCSNGHYICIPHLFRSFEQVSVRPCRHMIAPMLPPPCGQGSGGMAHPAMRQDLAVAVFAQRPRRHMPVVAQEPCCPHSWQRRDVRALPEPELASLLQTSEPQDPTSMRRLTGMPQARAEILRVEEDMESSSGI